MLNSPITPLFLATNGFRTEAELFDLGFWQFNVFACARFAMFCFWMAQNSKGGESVPGGGGGGVFFCRHSESAIVAKIPTQFSCKGRISFAR